MAEAEPRVTPPLGPTDAFSPWPTLLSARLGVATDGSVWAYVKGAVSMVAPAGTIPHPMMALAGTETAAGQGPPADALIASEPEPQPEHRAHETHHERPRRR